MTKEANPVLNPLIFYEILRSLPRSEVLKCRLVCSTWDSEACRFLRKALTLDFNDLSEVSRFHALLDNTFEIKPGRDIPFARIRLRTSFRLGHSLAQEFFRTHGHILRSLQILKVGCDCGANFFQRLLFYQATQLSSLDLQIISSPIRLSPESGYGPLRQLQLSSHLPTSGLELPNLRILHLRHQLFIERVPFIKELLAAVVNLERLTTDLSSPEFCSGVFLPTVLNSSNKWSKLRRLGSGRSIVMTNAQIELFRSKKIQLEDLSLDFNHQGLVGGEDLSKEALITLLRSMKETLRKLELNNRKTDESFELDLIPQMPRLQSLRLVNISLATRWLALVPSLINFELIEEEPSGLCLPLGDIAPSLRFPQLRKLTLSPMCILNLADLDDMAVWWNAQGHRYLGKLAQAFPNLRTLSLNGNDAILKAVFEHFPYLESLSIHGPITDEGLTGIPLDICGIMHSQQDYGLVNVSKLSSLFVGDMRNLQSLTIIPPSTCLLTEVCVFFGLVCCKDLKRLDLKNGELRALWEDEMRRMRESSESSS